MMKRIIMLILATIVAVSIIYFSYEILSIDTEVEPKESESIYISKVIEDECTEEYIEQENIKTVTSSEEKVSANAILILKKYYSKCEHTINEYVELPQELVNMTREEIQAQYSEWEVLGFESGQIILYKEFEDVCGEHFKLKLEDGKVVIYIINSDGSESVYEKTNISSEYLTEADLLNMQTGLEIYSKEELNQIIEDFE